VVLGVVSVYLRDTAFQSFSYSENPPLCVFLQLPDKLP